MQAAFVVREDGQTCLDGCLLCGSCRSHNKDVVHSYSTYNSLSRWIHQNVLYGLIPACCLREKVFNIVNLNYVIGDPMGPGNHLVYCTASQGGSQALQQTVISDGPPTLHIIMNDCYLHRHCTGMFPRSAFDGAASLRRRYWARVSLPSLLF